MIRNILLYICMTVVGAAAVATIVPSPALAATKCDKDGMIITLKPWYYGLTETDSDGKCRVKSPGNNEDAQKKFFGRVVLNIVEDLLQIAAYVTVAFVIIGGFKFMTSAGAPDQAAKARKTILNAVIGLVVAMASIGLVNFVGGYLGL